MMQKIDNSLKEPHPEIKCGKIAFFTDEGDAVTEFEYDETNGFFDGLAKVKREGKYGYIDTSGDEVVPCKYDEIWSFCDSLAKVRIGDKCGFVNSLGQEIVPCTYDDADNFLYGYARVQLSGKWGHIDTNGRIITSCKYADAEDFQEGLARVDLNGKIGFVNTRGQEVIPLKYDWAELFSEGLSAVRIGKEYGYIDTNGEIVIPLQYDDADYFFDGLAAVQRNGKYGIIDTTGHEVHPYSINQLQEAREIASAINKKKSLSNCPNMTELNKKTLSFVKSIYEELRIEMQKYPYPINVLDEVHFKGNVKENAHSRILKRLMEYDREGYSTFKSLLEVCFGKEIVNELQIDTPKFLLEASCPRTTGRIDILAKEQGRYAIIFENKVNKATDQQNQIARYIEHLSSWYDVRQIYVVYLSFDGTPPTHQTWVGENGDYEEAFRQRFSILSFNRIKNWLKTSILPTVNEKETFYKSALLQYIDYLDGYYNQREISTTVLHQLLHRRLGDISSAHIIKQAIDKCDCCEVTISTELADINETIASIDDIMAKTNELKQATGNVNYLEALLLSLKSIRRDSLRRHIQSERAIEYSNDTIQRRKNHLGYKVNYHGNDYYVYIGHNNHYLFCSALSKSNGPISPISQLGTFPEPLISDKPNWVATECQEGDYYTAINVLQNTLNAIRNAGAKEE